MNVYIKFALYEYNIIMMKQGIEFCRFGLEKG